MHRAAPTNVSLGVVASNRYSKVGCAVVSLGLCFVSISYERVRVVLVDAGADAECTAACAAQIKWRNGIIDRHRPWVIQLVRVLREKKVRRKGSRPEGMPEGSAGCG